MPRKAKRPCRYKGCPALTESESGYCTEHEKLMRKRYDRKTYDDKYNKYGRTAESKRQYSNKWKKTRAAFLALYPLCEMCKRKGIYKAAQEVHHIKPLSQGGSLTDFSNLMALCKSCHSKITFAENGGKWGKR